MKAVNTSIFQSKESGNGVGVVYMTMNDFTKGDTDVDLLDAEKCQV
jgi:hypothetical protein